MAEAKTALICGAGKIGRGFLGQLLHRGGYRLRFLDGSPAVVELLNRERRYRVDIAGKDGSTEYIPVLSANTLADPEAVRAHVAQADIMVSAVGAPNIAGLARFLKPLLAARGGRPLDWLICENADHPARAIREILLEGADEDARRYIEHGFGLVETQVLRTGMVADPAILAVEPLALRMHDWWTLPADAEAFRAPMPSFPGLQPRAGFANELTRKLYTFNGLNGPISYIGHANGHAILHESANDPRLRAFYASVMEESAHGLIGEFSFEPGEHRQFQRIAWDKYRDASLNDAIERNARDSARKLGPRERLVGPAQLCLKHGREPRAYAAAIAAAIDYAGSSDAGTAAVRASYSRGGAIAVLVEHCQLDAASPLARLVLAAHGRGEHLIARALGAAFPPSSDMSSAAPSDRPSARAAT